MWLEESGDLSFPNGESPCTDFLLVVHSHVIRQTSTHDDVGLFVVRQVVRV
jgi:hypothetical protein